MHFSLTGTSHRNPQAGLHTNTVVSVLFLDHSTLPVMLSWEFPTVPCSKERNLVHEASGLPGEEQGRYELSVFYLSFLCLSLQSPCVPSLLSCDRVSGCKEPRHPSSLRSQLCMWERLQPILEACSSSEASTLGRLPWGWVGLFGILEVRSS